MAEDKKLEDIKEDIIESRLPVEPKWINKFWTRHGDRLVFAGFAIALAEIMYFALGLKPQAETIIIGIAMLFFNKARGTNGGSDAKT